MIVYAPADFINAKVENAYSAVYTGRFNGIDILGFIVIDIEENLVTGKPSLNIAPVGFGF